MHSCIMPCHRTRRPVFSRATCNWYTVFVLYFTSKTKSTTMGDEAKLVRWKRKRSALLLSRAWEKLLERKVAHDLLSTNKSGVQLLWDWRCVRRMCRLWKICPEGGMATSKLWKSWNQSWNPSWTYQDGLKSRLHVSVYWWRANLWSCGIIE